MNESHIIQFLQSSFPEPNGIGDDAAVFPLSDTESYVITKDLLIENIHFRRRYFDAKSLAHKALHVNLSDISAMGAKPRYALLGISIPKYEDTYLNDFLKHFSKLCKEHCVTLIGGDTTASSDGFFISVTLIGVAKKEYLKFRRGAQMGDIVCVAGKLGYAHLGLQALENNIQGLSSFKEASLKPNALLAEGQFLGKQPAVNSMMDLSDGLYVDLSKLCEASSVSAEVTLDSFNYTPDFLEACTLLKLEPSEVALSGGEDYGLLVSIQEDKFPEISKKFQEHFHYPLNVVGKIIPKSKLLILFSKNGQPVTPSLKPFAHF